MKILLKLTAIVAVTGIIGTKAWMIEKKADQLAAQQSSNEQYVHKVDTVKEETRNDNALR